MVLKINKKKKFMKKLKSMKELNTIRGKMLVNTATQEELHDFLNYVNALEGLVEDASMEDFYGTEGWQKYLGISDN